jgi:Tfp pilus assembly protein PilN
MVEIGLAEYFGMAEAIGIIATMLVVLYFSRKQMEALSVDIETKILSDLDLRIREITRMMIDRTELIKVVSKVESNWSSDVAYSYHILFTFAHVLHMRKRNVLSDNEWTGWLRWMKSAFDQGTIKDIWKSKIEMEKWFDPAFQEFIDKEIIPLSSK